MVGYEDGTIRIWDLKQGNPIHVLKGIRSGHVWERSARQGQDSVTDMSLCFIPGTEGHQGPLTCVATNQDGSLILTGSVDCQAKLISATTGKVNRPGVRLAASAFPSLLPFLFQSCCLSSLLGH